MGSNGKIYFDDFELDAERRLLKCRGETIPLNAKAFDLFLVLVENRGRVLSKNELLDTVWENRFVEENNLTVHVAALRKALGEKKGDHRYILTVPGKGYEFVGELNENGDHEIVVESREVKRIVIDEYQADDRRNEGTRSPEDNDRTAIRSGRRRWREPGTAGSLVAVSVTLIALASLSYLFIGGIRERIAGHASFKPSSIARLTSSGRISSAAISPDGNYFVYAQDEAVGQSLWVRQIVDSRSIEIIPADAVEYWGLTFSSTGTHVYATVFTATQADPKLIRIPAIGGVVENLPNVSCSAVSFSPDGRRFAYVVSSSGSGGTLLRTARADGSDDKVLTILKDPSFFVFPGTTVAWSPKGDQIAVASKIVNQIGDHGAIELVNVADGTMQAYTSQPFPWIQSIAWLPDASGMIFAANEDGASPVQLWKQSLPGEAAQRITHDLNWYSSIDISADGRSMVAVQNARHSSLWVADYNGGIGPLKKVADEIGDFGEIAWTSLKEVVFRSSASGKQNLWLTTEGGAKKQLTKDAMPDKGLAVSPEGQYIVFSSYKEGRYNLWRFDVEHNKLIQLTNGTGEVFPRIAPDGRAVIYQQGVGEVRSTIWKIAIDGGDAIQITKTHSIYPALSPDGMLLCFFYMDTSETPKGEWRIAIARSDDGSILKSFPTPNGIIGRIVRWTPDSGSIVYAKSNGNVGNLWRQSLDGGTPVEITNFEEDTISDFQWSQDGNSFAITRSAEVRDAILLTYNDDQDNLVRHFGHIPWPKLP